MFTILDIISFLLCAGIWLGPFFNNLRCGRCRLLHPIGFLPLMMVYMTLPPLMYRLTGDPILLTSKMGAGNNWFLAEPLLVLGLGGVFYHLGVRLGGTSLTLGPRDNVQVCLGFKSVRDIDSFSLFISGCAVLALAFLMRLAMPLENFSKGYYWMHLFFKSFYILPLLIFGQDRRLGLWFLLLILPGTLLIRSKATFLYIAITFIVFYQGKILRLSKALTAIILFSILLTPVAVKLYHMDTAYSGNYQKDMEQALNNERSGFEDSWFESILTISRREYAFESFANVYQKRQQGEACHWGDKTLKAIILNIPSFIWPEKPFDFDDFPSEYLPLDYHGYNTHYAQYALTPFFLDWDIPGLCLGTLFFGFIFGYGYHLALKNMLRRQEIWPLIIYSTLVINAKYIVEADLFSGLTNSLGMALGGLLAVSLANLFVDKKTTSTQKSFHKRLIQKKSYL